MSVDQRSITVLPVRSTRVKAGGHGESPFLPTATILALLATNAPFRSWDASIISRAPVDGHGRQTRPCDGQWMKPRRYAKNLN